MKHSKTIHDSIQEFRYSLNEAFYYGTACWISCGIGINEKVHIYIQDSMINSSNNIILDRWLEQNLPLFFKNYEVRKIGRLSM